MSNTNMLTILDLESLFPRENHKCTVGHDSLFDFENALSSRSTKAGSCMSCYTVVQGSLQSLDTEIECAQQSRDLDSPYSTKSCQVHFIEKFKEMTVNQPSKITYNTSSKGCGGDLTDNSMSYQETVPTFGTYGSCTSSFSFLTEKRTALLHTNKFSTAFAKDPLPSAGKCKFTVYIEECKKMNPVLYIGVVSGESMNEKMAYRQGWTFISCFSPYSYLNGQKIIKENCLPRRGQVVTVLVDQDMGKISFEVNGTKIIEGKMSSKTKQTNIYPFICLGEKEGRVCFV
jgi:hypothetical protein